MNNSAVIHQLLSKFDWNARHPLNPLIRDIDRGNHDVLPLWLDYWSSYWVFRLCCIKGNTGLYEHMLSFANRNNDPWFQAESVECAIQNEHEELLYFQLRTVGDWSYETLNDVVKASFRHPRRFNFIQDYSFMTSVSPFIPPPNAAPFIYPTHIHSPPALSNFPHCGLDVPQPACLFMLAWAAFCRWGGCFWSHDMRKCLGRVTGINGA